MSLVNYMFLVQFILKYFSMNVLVMLEFIPETNQY